MDKYRVMAREGMIAVCTHKNSKGNKGNARSLKGVRHGDMRGEEARGGLFPEFPHLAQRGRSMPLHASFTCGRTWLMVRSVPPWALRTGKRFVSTSAFPCEPQSGTCTLTTHHVNKPRCRSRRNPFRIVESGGCGGGGGEGAGTTERARGTQEWECQPISRVERSNCPACSIAFEISMRCST